jgi:hypothetical protein
MHSEEHVLRRILARSSLARDLAACYDAIALGRTASLCINGEIDVLLRGPLPCPYGTVLARRAIVAAVNARDAKFRARRGLSMHSTDRGFTGLETTSEQETTQNAERSDALPASFASVGSVSHSMERLAGSLGHSKLMYAGGCHAQALLGRRRRMDAHWHDPEHRLATLAEVAACIKAHHALLLCDDPEVVLGHVPCIGGELPHSLVAFIEAVTPMQSMADLSQVLGYSLKQVIQLAAYLVYHRLARIIDVVRPRNIYVLSSEADMKR